MLGLNNPNEKMKDTQINISEESIVIPAILDDEQLINVYFEIEEKIKNYSTQLSTIKKEIETRSNGQECEIGKYKIQYKSSNLFDKELAFQWAEKNQVLKSFEVVDYDYKKMQLHIKAHCNYDDFVKKSNPTLKIVRK